MQTTKKPTKSLQFVSIRLVKEKEVPYAGTVKNPQQAASILRPFFKDLDREAFYVLSLNTSKEPTSINLVSVGSLNSSTVHPREVFKPAILSNAHSIIVAHNHPSGSKEPSKADIDITNQLKEAGRLLGINVDDHIVMYGNEEQEFTSLLSEGFFSN